MLTDPAAVFDRLWSRFGDGRALGATPAAAYAWRTDGPMCLTALCRLPADIAERCAAAAAGLASPDERHYHYPAADLHVTLRDLTPLAAGGDLRHLPEPTVAALRALCQRLRAEPPLRLRIDGVGMFPTTLFAQVIDVDGRIVELRGRIAAIVRDQLGIDLPPPPVPEAAFANLIRFEHAPGPGLVAAVARLRATSPATPTFTLADVEIVATDKVHSPANTYPHAHCRLSG